MQYTIVSVKLIHMSCGECGIQFAMDEEKYNRCQNNGEGWYCPNGHSRVFTNPKNKFLQKENKVRAQDNLAFVLILIALLVFSILMVIYG